MKLHLPVLLFRALVLLMLTAPAVEAASDSFVVTNDVTEYVYNAYTLENYDEVLFSKNISSKNGEKYSQGGAIYSKGVVTLANNEKVEFFNNSISASYDSSGGAIYSYEEVVIAGNGQVDFYKNKADAGEYAADGGAICSNGSISIKKNDIVSFVENSVNVWPDVSSRYTYAQGAALYAYDDITLSGNGTVLFDKNKSSCQASADAPVGTGGAVKVNGDVFSVSKNTSVIFTNNSLISSGKGARGHAYGGALGGSQYDVEMKENTWLEFGNNLAYGNASLDVASHGGAVQGTGITLNNNGTIWFYDNSAEAISNDTSGSTQANGGAIFAYGDVDISGNDCVMFSGNKASVAYTGNQACGGAMRVTSGQMLTMVDNDKVLFEKNAEIEAGMYRLRSIHAGGSVNLSVRENGELRFLDAIYVQGTLNLNEDYVDSKGNTHRQTGDIIFSGAYTEAHLVEVKGSAGTYSEIESSRTSEIRSGIDLKGGRLRVEDNAVLSGNSLSVVANTGAELWLKNGRLSISNSVGIGRGTTLGASGRNSISGSLNLAEGSVLTLNLSSENKDSALLSIGRYFSVDGSFMMNIGTSDASLEYGEYKLLDAEYVTGWSNDRVNTLSVAYTSDDMEWRGGVLYFNYQGQELTHLTLPAELADFVMPEKPGETVTPDEPTVPDTPVTPDEPTVPDMPVTPDEPTVPDTPVTPDEPVIPDIPVIPDEPVIPDTPVTPDEPVIPDTPVTPDEPEIPDTPVTPDEPEIPDTPVTPDEPEIPDTPVMPDEPEIPDTPVTPDEPENPDALKKFCPASPVLTSKEINEKTEVILTGKGNMMLEGKISAGAISVNTDKNLTFKSNKKNPGALSGSGKLTKRGNGTLTLNDDNDSWTGDTYLYAGTIKVKGTSSLGKGDVFVKGGTLNLGSKSIANDIIQSKTAAIKSGKKFTGTYTLEKGELQKGSTLNIARTATLEGGTVNGTLTGNGTTTVTGKVTLGDKGKITTKALILGDEATLTTSAKGLSSKATTLTIGENTLFSLGGKMTVDSLKINGGELKTTASKPAAMTVKNNMELTDATLTTNGKVTTNRLTLSESTMSIKGAKAQNLTVKQGLTLGSGSNLRLNGKLSAGALTIKSGGTLTMSGSKPVTLKVKGALTLNSGSSIILDYDFVQGKTYKVLTFGSYSGSKDYYSIFGVDADDCTITNTGKALTLTVTGKWNPQTQQKAVSVAAVEELVITNAPKSAANPVADALVQSNWGQLEACRAFVNAMANRSMAVQLGNGERAVWASAIGASSRHSSAGGHAGADTNVSGGAFGLETQVGRASLFGMALGNSWTRVSAHGFGTIEQDTTHLGLYGQTNWRSGVTADWSAAHGRSDSETIGTDWNQKHLQLDGRVSYNHELNAGTMLSPFAGLQYYASDSATVDGTSTGSLQNLRAEIGVAASRRVGKFGVFGEIALHQDIARNNPVVDMNGTRSTGMNPGRAGLNFTVGASYELNDKWSVNASYTGEFVENANSHSANIGATYKF